MAVNLILLVKQLTSKKIHNPISEQYYSWNVSAQNSVCRWSVFGVGLQQPTGHSLSMPVGHLPLVTVDHEDQQGMTTNADLSINISAIISVTY